MTDVPQNFCGKTPAIALKRELGRSWWRGRGRRAFSMLEILMALAIVGLVMVAMNTFMFSMGELWGRNSDLRLFELHVRNVTRFLESELRKAALPPYASATAQGINGSEVRMESGSTANLLTFELAEGSRIFTWPERALPDVMCSLAVKEREGLFLLWHSRLEKKFKDDSPRETLITPLVSEMTYDYYDENFKNWKNEKELRKETTGSFTVPQRLRLKFTYSGRSIETVVSVPVAAQGLPLL